MAEQGEEMCRLCMELGACVSMNEEYSRFPKPLPKMIGDCIGLSVSDDDNLPQHICNTCGHLLIIFYNYKNLCLQSDKKLKALAGLSSKPDILKDKSDQNSTQDSLVSANHKEIFVKKEVESSDDEQYDMDLDEANQQADEDWDGDESGLDPESTSPSKEETKTDDEFSQQLSKPTLEQMQEMKGIGVHICMTCNWQLDTWEAVEDHINKNPNCDVKLKCKLCLSIFTNVISLRTHIQSHKKQIAIIKKLNKNRDATYFSCNLCNDVYSEKEVLINHLQVEHCITVRMCKSCNMCYNRIHRCMLKDFQCPKCPKKFAKNNSLKKHMIVHKPKDTKGTQKAVTAN